MFDIIYGLLFDFIDFLKWFLPMIIVFSFIGYLIREGGKWWYMYPTLIMPVTLSKIATLLELTRRNQVLIALFLILIIISIVIIWKGQGPNNSGTTMWMFNV